MTYTLASPLTPYAPPAWDWHALLVAKGAYGGADAILLSYDRWCSAYGIDANLALAQACDEATYFTSARWKNEWNPAGLGITADNTPPNPFRSLDEGVRAHIEHLCCHAYAASDCPVDHTHLTDRRHFFHVGNPELADIQTAPFRWAKGLPGGDPLDYVRSIVNIANAVGEGPAKMPRIIVHAGHENIAQITSDPNGVINPASLRGGTGANGEMAWNSATADELTRLLAAAGADAVRTDAIYHANVYDQDADLVVAIHYDGVGGTGRAQYCMAATVHSGPSTEAADNLADAIVAEWYDSYPAAMGIAGNGPITVDMQQYYGGWYRSANTPMLLAEHCIGADANGIRADRPTPQAAAAADFAVLAKHFGLGAPAPPPDNKVNGHVLAGGFRALWDATPDRMRIFGFPVSEEYTGTLGGLPVTAQDFERLQLVYDVSTPDPFRVRVPLRGEKVGLRPGKKA